MSSNNTNPPPQKVASVSVQDSIQVIGSSDGTLSEVVDTRVGRLTSTKTFFSEISHYHILKKAEFESKKSNCIAPPNSKNVDSEDVVDIVVMDKPTENNDVDEIEISKSIYNLFIYLYNKSWDKLPFMK